MMSESTLPKDIPANPIEKLDVSLRDIFETDPIPAQSNVTVIDSPPAPSTERVVDDIDTDHAFARSNMYSLLQQGQDAFMHALEVAKQSENPRAFEVAGTIMKNLADMNNQLLDLHAKKAQAKPASGGQPEPMKVVNNSIVFQGSTAELSKMIQNMRKDQ